MKKNDGGPAFPSAACGAYIPDCEDINAPPSREFPGHPGMSLRDYFAAQAMNAMAMACIESQPEGLKPDQVDAACARAAYRMADAMLAERDK